MKVEVVGKVFVVVGGKQKCMICDGVFTAMQAADHAATPCYPQNKNPNGTKVHLIRAPHLY
jgi:hypothetical protein